MSKQKVRWNNNLKSNKPGERFNADEWERASNNESSNQQVNGCSH